MSTDPTRSSSARGRIGPLRVGCVPVSALDRQAWSSLAQGGDIEAQYGFLRWLDDAGCHDRQMVVASDTYGYVGALPLVRVGPQTMWLCRPGAQLGARLDDHDTERLERELAPAFSVRNLWDADALLAERVVDMRTVVDQLVGAASAVAREEGAASLTFLSVPEDRRIMRACLRSAGFIEVLYDADAEVRLHGAISFDDSLARCSARRRQRIRNERSRLRRAGIVVEELPMDQLEEVVALEAQSWAAHGDDVGFDRLWQLRSPLREHLAEQARLLGVRDPDRGLVAGAVHLHGRHSYHSFTYGAVPGLRDVYLELCIYEPMRWAAEHRLERVGLGGTALLAKGVRGGTIRRLYAYVLPLASAVRSTVADVAEVIGLALRAELEELMQVGS